MSINLTSNVLITQSFTQTSGTSTFYGAGLFSPPTVGSTSGGITMSGGAARAAILATKCRSRPSRFLAWDWGLG